MSSIVESYEIGEIDANVLTDKIQAYFDTFHRVGKALCYILPHRQSMSFLEILLGNDI